MYIVYCKSIGIPFTMTCSNYTTQIETDMNAKRFVYSMQSNRCFAAFAKVKSNVKGMIPPDVSISDLNYFHYDFKGNMGFPCVYNIDLKSAYASVLHREGIIKKDTMDYLSRISKYDRLASVGMLAAKKQIFRFGKDGSILSYEEQVSHTENFFYFAVQKTFQIMQNLKAILGDRYLFTWVDGIYFQPSLEKLTACENYLRRNKLRYSEEILRDWSVVLHKNNIDINFIKEGHPKAFRLPSKQTEFQRIMGEAKSFLNNKNKTNALR